MEKKNNKFEITIIFIVIIFSIIMYLMYLLINEYNKKYEFTIITNPLTILNCKKWDCTNETIDLYNNSKLYTNIDGIDTGLNTLYYNESNKRFYIFDNSNNSLKYTNFYMYNGNIKGIPLTKEEISSSELNELSNTLNIDTTNTTYTEKISLDFDNDEKLEYLYNIIGNNNTYYSYLIYKDNNKYKFIHKSIEEDITKFNAGTIDNILDIFNDKKYEFIFHISYYDEIGDCAVIYRLKRNKFVNINECSL